MFPKWLPIVSFLLVVSFAPCAGVPSRLISYEPEFYEVSEAVETPHTCWAKPLAGEPLRVLVIAPWGCQRHTVELAQRLEMEYEVFFTTRRSTLGYDEGKVRSWAWVKGLFEEEREAALRRYLPGNWDAVVVGCDWRGLPLWARHEIAKSVQAGAGLLLGYRQKGTYLDRMLAASPAKADLCVGIPTTAFANLAHVAERGGLATLGDFGKGRIAMLNHGIGGSDREYLTPREDTPAAELDYDVYQALAIRALLWCCRREASMAITEVSPNNWSLEEVPEALAVSVDSRTTVWRAEVEVVWRDRQGREYARSTSSQRIPAGDSRVAFSVPELPAGRWFASVRVLADACVVAFACLPVDVRSNVALVLPNTPLADSAVRLQVGFTKAVPPATAIEVEVGNAFGDVLCKRVLAVPEGAESLELPELGLPPALCVWHELVVRLIIDGRTISVGRREWFREWRRAVDDFSLVTWYGPSKESYFDRLVNQAFRRAGVDTVYASHVWGEDAAQRCVESVRAGLGVLPYVCAVRLPRNGKAPAHQRVPAVTDPAYLAELIDQVKSTATGFRPLCPAGYSLGDENYFGGSEGQ